jgi:hypothetical protein
VARDDANALPVSCSPELLSRVSQKDPAAFLGVTAVGLNRIGKRVRAGTAGPR